MSATDELRRLLDERGIIWQDKTNDGDRCEILPGDSVTWWFDHNDVLSAARENFGHKLALRCECTPAQAIEITLGRGKCKFEIKDNCNDSEGTCCDVWFECSGCHARFDYIADEWLMYENYCPACGREVER